MLKGKYCTMGNNLFTTKNDIIEECILSLASGDLDSMDILYQTIKTDVYAFALSKVCSKFDADDIMQDTFIRIYENAKLYVPKGKPLAWIFAIETNLINRYFQLKKKNQTFDENMLNETLADETYPGYCDSVNSDLLAKLLKHLDDFEREVITLHLASEMKFKEIAKHLNKPLSTILSKYNRAIKKLQKLVKEVK